MGDTFSGVKGFLSAANVAAVPIAGEVTVYTRAIDVRYLKSGAIKYIASSGGTVNVQMELEQSDVLPATEGAADDDWVVSEGGGTFDTVTDEVKHLKALSAVTCRYIRLKLTGLTGNDATTTLTPDLIEQEER